MTRKQKCRLTSSICWRGQRRTSKYIEKDSSENKTNQSIRIWYVNKDFNTHELTRLFIIYPYTVISTKSTNFDIYLIYNNKYLQKFMISYLSKYYMCVRACLHAIYELIINEYIFSYENIVHMKFYVYIISHELTLLSTRWIIIQYTEKYTHPWYLWWYPWSY